jgi:taurine dioxygenase
MLNEWEPPKSFSAYRRIQVRRVAGAIGAEISGVDVSADLPPEVIEEITQALNEHHVIFFRDQALTPQRQAAFASWFGSPTPYPMVKGLDGTDEVVPVIKNAGERVNFGGLWHADTTYLEEPPMGALLYAVELPPYGGDTLFANMHLAYETLSPRLQAFLETLTVVQNSAKAEVSRTREDRIRDQGGVRRQLVAEHPAVITHPRTGRKTLFVNAAHTEQFKELTPEESEPLLQFLFQHLTRPEFTCRFAWTPGALAFWDNYATQHNPINDYHGFRRVMHRVTIGGGRPRLQATNEG